MGRRLRRTNAIQIRTNGARRVVLMGTHGCGCPGVLWGTLGYSWVLWGAPAHVFDGVALEDQPLQPVEEPEAERHRPQRHLSAAQRGTLEYSGVLWGTLGYSGVLWGTLGYSGALWGTLGYSGLRNPKPSGTVRSGTYRPRSGVLWGTLVYSGVLWRYSGVLWGTLGYSGVL